VRQKLPKSMPTSARGLTLVFLTVAVAWVVLTGDGLAAERGEADIAVRDRPLPERWTGTYHNNPVFDGRVYVVQAGPTDAPPVLLVHGLGQSGYQDWWEVIDALEGEYRVVALDLPGFGRSDAVTGGLSPPRYAALLDWLSRELELEPVRLVGHSMGAAVALYFAGAYPDRVERVVLADVAGVLQRVAFLRGVLAEQSLSDGLPGALGEGVRDLLGQATGFMERLVVSQDWDVVEILRHSQTAWNALLADRANVNAALSLLQTDFSGVIETFDHPTTLIWGAQDDVTPVRTGYLLRGRLPAHGLRLVSGAGHTPMRTHTQKFLTHLRAGLEGPGDARPDQPESIAEPPDYECIGQAGRTISGHFDRIVVRDCPDMELVDVRARRIRVTGSQRVRLRRVVVDGGPEPALVAVGSDVTATDLIAQGEPAVRLDTGRLDVAGSSLRARGPALAVEREATVVLSVSHVASGVRNGFLHGATRVGGRVVDGLPALASPGTVDKRIDAAAPTWRDDLASSDARAAGLRRRSQASPGPPMVGGSAGGSRPAAPTVSRMVAGAMLPPRPRSKP